MMHNPDLRCDLPNYLQIFCAFNPCDITEFPKVEKCSNLHFTTPVKNWAFVADPESQIKKWLVIRIQNRSFDF